MSMSHSREEHAAGRRHALVARDREAANTFYTGLLRGRLVHQARRRSDGAHLWFRFDDVLVETGPGADDRAPVLLHVDDPLAVAERCWDAGFTVRLLDPPFGHATVSVTDPFGRQVNLAPAAGQDSRQAASGD
jgi:catechol 2,3-dioxygenase-like lactoylglutathione lyase family enzyme